MKKILIVLIGILILLLLPIVIRAANIEIKENIKVEAKTGNNVIKNGDNIKIKTGEAQAKINIKTKINDQDLEPFIIDLEEGEIKKEVIQEKDGVVQEIEAEVKVEKGEEVTGEEVTSEKKAVEKNSDQDLPLEKIDKIEKPVKSNGVLNFFEILRGFFAELRSWMRSWF